MIEFSALEAIEEALEVLTKRATETDTASPEGWRARAAIETLCAVREQIFNGQLKIDV